MTGKVGYVNWDAILTQNLIEALCSIENKLQPCIVVSEFNRKTYTRVHFLKNQNLTFS